MEENKRERECHWWGEGCNCIQCGVKACPGSGMELASVVAPLCFSFGRKLEAARWARGGEKVGAGQMRLGQGTGSRMAGKEGRAPGDSQTLVPLAVTESSSGAALCSLHPPSIQLPNS